MFLTGKMANRTRNTAKAEKDDPESSFSASFQQLTTEIFRLNTRLLTIGDQLSQDMEISTARWQVLATIRSEAITVAEISRRLLLRRQSVRETVNRLEAQKLVTLTANPRHVRAPLIQLTQKGQKVMNTLRERQLSLVDVFIKELGFSVADIDFILNGLRKTRELAERIDPLDFK